MAKRAKVIRSRRDGPMHEWFGLSYANYLTIPRSLIQEMPLDWQERMARCLHQMAEKFDDSQVNGGHYVVQVRDPETGRFVTDPLAAYRHPDWAAVDRARVRRSA